MHKRKRPKDLRSVNPRVCATCHDYTTCQGGWGCQREGALGDTGDMTQYETVCDYWQVRNEL